MRRSGWMVLVLMAVAVNSISADQFFARQDVKDWQKPSTSIGVTTPQVEMFVYHLQVSPKIDLGKRVLIPYSRGGSVLTGGFLSYWALPRKLFIESWSLVHQRIGIGSFDARLIGYAPLNGGRWLLCSDQTALTWPVARRVAVGVAADWSLTQGAKSKAGVGPIINLKLGQSTLTIRALYGAREPDSFRVETFVPF